MGILGSLGAGFGWLVGNKDREEGDRLEEPAIHGYDGMSAPQLERMQAADPGKSAFEGLQMDGTSRLAQLRALSSLGEMGQGMTGQDRAAAENALEPIQSDAAARDAGIRADMRARGTGGGAGEAVARQVAAQQQASRGRSAGTSLQLAAQQRALQALQAQGQLGGQMRGQEYGEASGRATAMDNMARQHAAYQQEASRYNAGLGQQQFQDQMQLTGARVGAYTAGAKHYQGKADSAVGAGQAVGQQVDDTMDEATKLAMRLGGGI